jgi:MFS family permease
MTPRHANAGTVPQYGRNSMSGHRTRTRRRMLHHYPGSGRRYWYLGVAVSATIVLYYELYVTGSVAPLVLAHYKMSFLYYVDVLVISNLVGAFGSLLVGLGDRWGRANIVTYGLGVTGLLSLATPLAPDKQSFAALLILVSLVEGMVLVATPALVRDFSPQLGRASAMGFWTLGPVVGSVIVSFVANRTLPSLNNDWASQYEIVGVVGLVTFAVALFGLRELSPALRDQVMVSTEDRAVLEARAASGGQHARPKRRWRQVLGPDILLPAIGISVFNLIYYVTIGFSTIYLTTIYGFTTHTVNGINTWFWLINAAALIVVGVMSDQLRVRKPFMVMGAALAAVMTFVFLSRATVPDTSATTMIMILAQLAVALAITYVPWMAAFTETVERRNPALMTTALAVWGWLVRLCVCISFLALPVVVRSMNTLVNAPAVLAQAQAQPPSPELNFQLAQIQQARIDAPLQWQHWWWICIAAEVLFVLLALPLYGRWSPRAAFEDLRRHRQHMRILAAGIPAGGPPVWEPQRGFQRSER